MSYCNRKFHLSYTLPDGNVWKGFINVYADIKEELATIEDIKGSFWVCKTEKGWQSEFNLDTDNVLDRRKIPNPHNWNRTITNEVITTGVFKPSTDFATSDTLNSCEEAYNLYKSISSISDEYEMLDKFEARLEDCLTNTVETHCWN